jgi:hypothetical protein
MFDRFKKAQLIRQINKLAPAGVWRSVRAEPYYDSRLNHCIIDKVTPEQSFLYIVKDELQRAREFDDFKGWLVYDYQKEKSPRTAQPWYWLARQWRNNGRVEIDAFRDFIRVLDLAKARWPQLFSGETPALASWWSIYFQRRPEGTREKPEKIFSSFKKAANYVSDSAGEPLWWHSYDLRKMADAGKETPNWKEVDTPEEYQHVDAEDHYGWNDGRKESDKVVFAMPRSTHSSWKSAVEARDYHRDSGKKIRRHPTYGWDQLDENVPLEWVESWSLEKMEIEIPIDNECPNASDPYYPRSELNRLEQMAED